jgi:hypothetical protein
MARFVESGTSAITKVHLRTPKAKGAKKYLLDYAQKALKILRENIRTNKGGTWKRIQWGLRKGQLALSGTEDQWRVEYTSGFKVMIKPIDSKVAMWRGHISGATIRPKKPTGFLHFFLDDGTEWFLKKVKLPKRDPRPSANQLRFIRIKEK